LVKLFQVPQVRINAELFLCPLTRLLRECLSFRCMARQPNQLFGEILSIADGVIVASSLKRDGVWWNEVDPDRITAFMSVVKSLR